MTSLGPRRHMKETVLWGAKAHVRTELWEPQAVGSQLKASLSHSYIRMFQASHVVPRL